MSESGNTKKSFEELQQMARDAIVTPSQAVNLLRHLGELLFEEGHLVRAAGVFRSLEVMTGEPYRPKPPGGAEVVQIPRTQIKPTG